MAKMIRLLSAFLLSASMMVAAELISGLALTVNNAPVTMVEVYEAARYNGVDNKRAVDMLVEQKLLEQEMERLGVVVDDAEVEDEARRIAQQQKVSYFQLKDTIEQRYGSIDDYFDELRKRLQKEKLLTRLARQNISRIDDAVMQNYYNDHADEFQVAEQIMVEKYFSQDERALDRALSGVDNESPEVQRALETVASRSVNPELARVLNGTAAGSFTPSFPVQGGWMAFKIIDKREITILPYEQVKNAIFAKLATQERERTVAKRLEALKATAKVTIFRLPPDRG